MTLAITAAAVGGFLAVPPDAARAAVSLAVLTGLFVLRVAGQLVVRTAAPPWLPPGGQWALTPYPVLLPAQLAILGLMAWIDADLARGRGLWTTPMPALGAAVVWLSFLYAATMAIRYVVRMKRRPEQRWFGGAIPIVFHWVLAAYLFVLGTYHAGH